MDRLYSVVKRAWTWMNEPMSDASRESRQLKPSPPLERPSDILMRNVGTPDAIVMKNFGRKADEPARD